MIFLNFFARALAFHVLLIPVITLLGAVILLTLIRLKKASASLRAGISGATLIVILILPWAAMTVPKVTIPIFSSVPDAQTESSNRHLPPAGVILPPPVLSQAPEVVSEPIPSAELSKASPTTKPSPYRFNWRVLSAVVILALICVWILGVVWGLGVLILGMVGIFRLRLSSHLVADDRLVEALHASCARLNYRGSVLFLISDRVALPITWGWLRAKIALPQDALNWPAERIDAALLHELAHIKRHDFAIQTLSRITCVFHWYNPLVLRLFRVWKNEAEQACDDLVLRSGYSGERYSDILLEVWRSATIPRPQSSLGLAMVRTSTLEQRVIAILDPEREREEVSPRNKLQLFAIFGGITVLIAVIGLTRPTNYHLTPELQNDMQAILRQVQMQEDTHLSLQLGLERQQEYWSSAKGAFEPQPRPTLADITLELTGKKARYRAHYHPSVNRWTHGAAPFYIESKTDVSDGDNTWTILSERHDNFKWKAGGDIGFLAGFGYRADDQVRTVINGLEGNGFTPFNGASYGIERTILNGAPAIRVQDIITLGGAQRRTWWFDPKRDYALIQYEMADFNNGSSQPSYSEVTSVEQLQKVADGVWYPMQFTMQSFRYVDGQLTDDSYRSTTKITSLVALPPINPATFQVTSVAADLAAPIPAKPTAQEIYDATFQRYAKCSTFSCTGTYEQHSDGLFGTTDHRTFSIRYARPAKIRVEWTQPSRWWSDSDTSAIYTAAGKIFSKLNFRPTIESDKSIYDAISEAAGVSGTTSYLLPSLLMGNSGYLDHWDLERRPDETVAGDDCYVIELETKGFGFYTLDIRKSDHAILRAVDVFKADVVDAQRSRAHKENPASFNDPGGPMKTNVSDTATTDFKDVVFDQPLKDEDFLLNATSKQPAVPTPQTTGTSQITHNSRPQGNVLNANGEAVAKADGSTIGTLTITITPEPPPGIQFEKIAIQDQNPAGSSRLWKLSADGHSFQARLSPGNYNFRIIGRTHSGQLYFSEIRFLKVEDSGPSLVKLDTFTPAFRLTGSVDASVPRPIKNGMVLACVTTGFTDPRTGWLTWNSTVEIHPDGTFDIPNLPTPTGLPKSTDSTAPPLVGQLELIATCDGYISKDPATKRMEYAVGPQVFDPPVPQPVTLTMEPLGSARVRVLDPQGNPLGGALVRFSPNESFRWISTFLGSPMDDEKTLFMGQNGDPTWQQLQKRYQAITDQDGVAVVKGLPSGLEPYIVLNTPYDVPYRLRLDQSSTKYAQNGIVVTEPGTQVSAEMRLIPKIAPILIPNATSPDGKYVVSVEPSQGLPMSVAEPQSVVVREAKTGKYVNSTFLPSNPDRQVDLIGPSDMVKAQWNSTSSFFIFSVLRKDRLEFTVVAFNSKDIGMATSDIAVSYGHDFKVISLELTGERAFKAKIEQKDGTTFYQYATVNNIGQVTMGSEPDAPKASTQNSQSQGKVLNANGEPVANAAISLVSAGQLITITDGQIDSKAENILSTSDGDFTLNQPGVAGDLLVVVHEDGYAVIPWGEFSGTITLTSWAKVSGTALGETMPAAQKSVEFQMSIPLNPRSLTEGQVRLLSRATVDSQGSFLASHVPIGVVDAMLAAGPLSDQHSLLDQHSLMETIHIETQADQTARADFGGKGITVTGKAEMPNDPDLDLNWGQIFWARSPVGLNIPSGMPQEQADKLTREYYASDAGKKALLATRVQYFHIQPDGSFKIENVSPGSYELRIDFIHKPAEGSRNWSVGNTSSSVEVKPGDTSVDVPLLKLHLLPKPPNSTTSNDARNPSLPASLQMEGEKLTLDQIAALEQKVATDPSDLPDRVRILGYYFLKRISQSSAQDAAQPHLLWIIRNLPASAIAGNPITNVDYRTDLPHYEEASEAWKEALAKYPNDPKVIGNAAAFYLLNEPKRAEKLLLQGQKLEPNDAGWAMHLGQLYTLRSMGPDLSVKTASKAEALKWFEQGLSSLKGIDRFYALEAPAKAAFEAGDFATAHEYAQELLQMAPQYPKDWNYGNAIYTGNSILGQIALAQGDTPSAKNYLEAAGESPGSPQLNTFGPDLTLARQLLSKGEKDATLAFLGKIAKFWAGHQEKIQGWQTAIQQGQTTF